ncbi:hypothetical protein C2E23DRAFT_887222 [Lenzites betulinus]|nr:hypothetical protein C2E23DRAFT_887222 [Lenzites betulinus]
MTLLTYHQRIKNVLSMIAKDDQQSLPYSELLERVRDSMALDLMTPTRGFEKRIRKAVLHERLAHRVKLAVSSNGLLKLTLTLTGVQYFRNFGVLTLYHHDEPSFRKLTVRELRKETQLINDVLAEIRGVIREGYGEQSQAFTDEDIPGIISQLLQKADNLGGQYTKLSSMLAEERKAERALLFAKAQRAVCVAKTVDDNM